MSGRSRRKKLQRANRITQADSLASPPSEEAIASNPLFSSDPDNILASSTNIEAAAVEDISTKEEKLDEVKTNKENEEKEKHTEGKENSSAISQLIQSQPPTTCGPTETKVDSLLKTVDIDESAYPISHNRINTSEGSIVDDNANLNNIESSVNSITSHTSIETCDSNSNLGNNIQNTPVTTCSQRGKSRERIYIAKSDTIIESREEVIEVEISAESADEVNLPSINSGDSAFKSDTQLLLDNSLSEEEKQSDFSENLIEIPSIPESSTPLQKCDNIEDSVVAEKETQSTIYFCENPSDFNLTKQPQICMQTDWNVIVEEDESDENGGERNEDICKDVHDDPISCAEPQLIKVKAYNLPERSTVDILESNAEESNEQESTEIETEICNTSEQTVLDNYDAPKEVTIHATPEINVVDDNKEGACNISSSIQVELPYGPTPTSVCYQTPPQIHLDSSFSESSYNRETPQCQATEVADMGDSTSERLEEVITNNNPKWHRAAVRAVQLQESSKKFTNQDENEAVPYISQETKNKKKDCKMFCSVVFLKCYLWHLIF